LVATKVIEELRCEQEDIGVRIGLQFSYIRAIVAPWKKSEHTIWDRGVESATVSEDADLTICHNSEGPIKKVLLTF
jgi:hypothetical protein